MRRVALATSRHALPDAAGPNANPDLDSPLIVEAAREQGLDVTLAVWNDPQVAWEDYDAVVVRSTWDYTSHHAEFLEWARARRRLFNSYEALRYSSDKHYLLDLERRGVPVVPTRIVELGEEPEWWTGDVVVKPAIGAGSADAARYGDTDEERQRAFAHVARLHAEGRVALVQPYVDSVDERGELALLYFGGVFSHALVKRAMLNTPEEERDASFRRRQMSAVVPDAVACHVAEATLSILPGTLYARVDLVETARGWAVMEMELVEPNLFLTFEPHALGRFVDALLAAL